MPSEHGVNWEMGIKYSLLDDKITGLISAFHLTRENVSNSDMTTPNPYDVTVSGEQQSRGIEFETAAKLAPGWDFTLAYAYIDAEITADNEFPVGAPLIGVPEHSINAWLKYTVQEGWAEGFGMGLGGRYCTSQSGGYGPQLRPSRLWFGQCRALLRAR